MGYAIISGTMDSGNLELTAYEVDGNRISEVPDTDRTKRIIRKRKKMSAQNEFRFALMETLNIWNRMNRIIHRSWEKDIDGDSLSAQDHFLGKNTLRLMTGEHLILSKPIGIKKISSFSATKGSSGKIICSFNNTEEKDQNHMIFFTQKIINGKGTGALEVYEAGPSCNSPFVIEGLEPGQEYHVYAVGTDKKFKHAKKITHSVAATSVAGL